ncbi:hypothetical protein BJ170DRAFT_687649 [Xylariales sp. AK1849]|nr:hypothetical protein BJ170DRAFT_687649 [Xylariales sp. AK1849]
MAPITRNPHSSYTGHQLACEEYAALGEDFCYWVHRPYQLSARHIALDREFLVPIGGEHEWELLHIPLVAIVFLYAMCILRSVLRDGSVLPRVKMLRSLVREL